VICLELPMVSSPDGSGLHAVAVDSVEVLGAVCSVCDRKDHIVYLPDGQRCPGCRGAAMSRREECSRCGRLRRVFFNPGICADCLGVNIGGVCVTCGIEDLLYAAGKCAGCVLASRVAAMFADTGEAGRAVAARLAASTQPRSTLRWLAQSPVARLLVDLLQRSQELDHGDLDAIARPARADDLTDRRQTVENARLILVACSLLPARNELSHRYETWAHQVLAKVDPATDRWMLLKFHRMHILPSVEARCESGKATYGTVKWAQTHLRGAVELLAWCHPSGGISALDRADLDTWFAGPSSHHAARDFLLWTIRQRLLNLPTSAIPRRAIQSPVTIEDHQVRADLVRGLLREDGYPADIRVAGLLVALFGQHLSRIVRIEHTHVQADVTPARIKLGKKWLELPDPLGQHIGELIASGPRRKSPFMDEARWLFPGFGAGAHLSSKQLGVRLAGYGIHASPMRNMALFQIAATVQASTLARLLGMHPTTAVKWVNEPGGVYANYWAQFLHDQQPEDIDLVDFDADGFEEDPDDDILDLLDQLDAP
jgi:hypothetical protein